MSLLVKKITVEKLFGKFNYDLNLDNGYDVSILIAPNGCGKTTILNFLSFILNPTTEVFFKIYDIPFVKYSCILSDNTCLELFKDGLDDERIYLKADRYKVFVDKDNISKFISLWDGLKSLFSQYPEMVKNFRASSLQGYEVKPGESAFVLFKEYQNTLSSDRSKNAHIKFKASKFNGENIIKQAKEQVEQLRKELISKELEAKKFYNQFVLSKNKLNQDIASGAQNKKNANEAIISHKKYQEASSDVEFFRDKLNHLAFLNENLQERNDKFSPDLFFKAFYNATKEVKINFIQANRLYAINNDGQSEDAITIINKDIKNRFKTISEEYIKKLSAATDNVVVQFVNPNDNARELATEHPDYKKVKENWDEYVRKVTRLSMSNLIDSKSQFIYLFDNIKPEDEKMILFMQLCTEQFNKTLEPFEDFDKQLDCFTRILNERNKITEKVLSFSKDEGFTLKTWDGRPLRLERMSSGEKNDFVMFYNLIFNSNNENLVLIDEPEISLHIRWQKNYMDNLIYICKMNNLQAFVATHSPHIINKYTDLIVERDYNNEE